MMSDGFHTVYLGLGSNLGDREANITRATELIGKHIGCLEALSGLYRSEPWGFESENAFVNAVVRVATTLSPRQLLNATQKIERMMGKQKKHAPERASFVSVYHDRPIDIDILLYDDLQVCEPGLVIPHPLMQQRPFVMEPLGEVLEGNTLQ